MPVAKGEYQYDVALSFAGEDRLVVEKLAVLLREKGLEVFYDDFKKSDLWGRDLYQHLDDVYANQARFCVMFLSEAYARKAWTNHELKSAQSRAFLQKNEAYILPVRIDDTAIPGIRPTMGYLDLRKVSIEEVAAAAIEKIAAAKPRGARTDGRAEATPEATKPAAPLRAGDLRMKRQFTEQERDTFLEQAFEKIAEAFESSLATLENEYEGITGKYRRVSANHFTATVYRNGKTVSKCGIRMGGMFGGNQILYSTDPHSTNSMNEAVSVENDGNAIYLKPMGMSAMFRGQGKGNEKLTPQEAAELFWGMLLGSLLR